MKKSVFLIALLLYAISTPASAYLLKFNPTVQTQAIPAGVTVHADFYVSGLGGVGDPSVGAFDINVGFDPSVLRPTFAVFDSGLGDPNDSGQTLNSFDFSIAGLVNIAEVSLLDNTTLDSLQPNDTLHLGMIKFITLQALTPGVSELFFSSFIVDDGFGNNLLPLDVTEGSVYIPEPSTVMLFVSGLAGFVSAKARKHAT